MGTELEERRRAAAEITNEQILEQIENLDARARDLRRSLALFVTSNPPSLENIEKAGQLIRFRNTLVELVAVELEAHEVEGDGPAPPCISWHEAAAAVRRMRVAEEE